jgi:hypothetical protein
MAAPVTGNKSGLQQVNTAPVRMPHILVRMALLYGRLKNQERYLTKQVSPALIKRTTKYLQLSLNVICDNLYQLTGRKLHADEHKRIVLLSMFGPLFDDLFDDRVLGHQQIESLVDAPETYIPVNSTDEQVVKTYLELLKMVPRQEQFIQHLKEVCYWQKESLRQLSDDISEEDLYNITYNKSYYAVLLYCSVLDNYPGKEILEIIYPVSGLMQLTNDAFDVWKDVHNGVYTLPNLHRNFEQLKNQFKVETALINNKLAKLPYTAKAKRAFAITVHALPAMGWMALEQLEQVTAGVKDLKTLSRKKLVCDMDSLSQQIKWLKLIKRFSNYKAR